MKLQFTFNGYLEYDNGRKERLNETTVAVTTKQALNNIKTRVLEGRYFLYNLIRFTGEVYVKGQSSFTLYIKRDAVVEFPLENEVNRYKKENKSDLHYEQIVDKLLFEEEQRCFKVSVNNNNRGKLDCIIVNGREYIYDKEDGVYWLDGVRYSEYVVG